MKRLFDIFFSFAVLLITSPFILVLIQIILLIQGRPIFFKQQRLGKDHKVFNLYKFCSMKNLTDSDGNLLPDIDRITKFGHILRILYYHLITSRDIQMNKIGDIK